VCSFFTLQELCYGTAEQPEDRFYVSARGLLALAAQEDWLHPRYATKLFLKKTLEDGRSRAEIIKVLHLVTPLLSGTSRDAMSGHGQATHSIHTLPMTQDV